MCTIIYLHALRELQILVPRRIGSLRRPGSFRRPIRVAWLDRLPYNPIINIIDTAPDILPEYFEKLQQQKAIQLRLQSCILRRGLLR